MFIESTHGCPQTFAKLFTAALLASAISLARTCSAPPIRFKNNAATPIASSAATETGQLRTLGL
jgi:hypothetical protein